LAKAAATADPVAGAFRRRLRELAVLAVLAVRPVFPRKAGRRLRAVQVGPVTAELCITPERSQSPAARSQARWPLLEVAAVQAHPVRAALVPAVAMAVVALSVLPGLRHRPTRPEGTRVTPEVPVVPLRRELLEVNLAKLRLAGLAGWQQVERSTLPTVPLRRVVQPSRATLRVGVRPLTAAREHKAGLAVTVAKEVRPDRAVTGHAALKLADLREPPAARVRQGRAASRPLGRPVLQEGKLAKLRAALLLVTVSCR
jgi:hypothetical protein